MIELIRKRLLNGETILNVELISLCEFYDIKVGPRTKGFIRTYIESLYVDNTVVINDKLTFNFIINCLHPDSADNPEYTLPNGLQDLFNKLTEYLYDNKDNK